MALRDLVTKYEGLRLKPYRDTVGKLTIGVGRNIEDIGVSMPEAMFMLSNDLARVQQECLDNFTWLKSLNQARQDVICSMVFNMGLRGFNEFKELVAALKNQDYEKAAEEMLNSKWSTQVPARAQDSAQIMRLGKY